MLKAEDYRLCAKECIRLASKTADMHDKALLVAMAERWCDLADRAAMLAELEGDRRDPQERPGWKLGAIILRALGLR